MNGISRLQILTYFIYSVKAGKNQLDADARLQALNKATTAIAAGDTNR